MGRLREEITTWAALSGNAVMVALPIWAGLSLLDRPVSFIGLWLMSIGAFASLILAMKIVRAY